MLSVRTLHRFESPHGISRSWPRESSMMMIPQAGNSSGWHWADSCRLFLFVLWWLPGKSSYNLVLSMSSWTVSEFRWNFLMCCVWNDYGILDPMILLTFLTPGADSEICDPAQAKKAAAVAGRISSCLTLFTEKGDNFTKVCESMILNLEFSLVNWT